QLAVGPRVGHRQGHIVRAPSGDLNAIAAGVKISNQPGFVLSSRARSAVQLRRGKRALISRFAREELRSSRNGAAGDDQTRRGVLRIGPRREDGREEGLIRQRRGDALLILKRSLRLPEARQLRSPSGRELRALDARATQLIEADRFLLTRIQPSQD